MSKKYVFSFSEGNAGMKDLLGGKGANLAEMTNIGLPVPPGFTITTEACRDYLAEGGRVPDELSDQAAAAVAQIEEQMGKKLGDPENPLLVSVRSGAKFSMPGMMDTVLNLGLNPLSLKGLIKQTGNERFAYDAYRRFIMMFSDIVLDISRKEFETLFDTRKEALGVKLDTEVSADALKGVCQEFLKHVEKRRGAAFPTEPSEQLRLAIEAVFQSWDNDRAHAYRDRERIPHDLGTAVNVQSMVFGNMGDDSGTGVAFTRDMATGENVMYGEYLMNAQGEDVVAGTRTPLPIAKLREESAELYGQFEQIAEQLERHYRDAMDLEFTIEKGKLFILQCRVGKRTAQAAVRIAVEMANEGLISREEAITRVRPGDLDQLLHPQIDPLATVSQLTSGIAASPGAASGHVIFSSDAAAEKGKTEPLILVRPETNPDDIRGMMASRGVLTARGGMTSHAAVVARGFGIPCVAGCETLDIDEEAGLFRVGDVVVREGDYITLDGATGRVILGSAPLVEPRISVEFKTLLEWADAIRRLDVRANADNPKDAAKAFEFGAQGIGLCRTEHMFFERGRLPIVQDMILSKDEHDRRSALNKLGSVQQSDFEGIFEAMRGRPVTIRLIDPPLHEFLPRLEDVLASVVDLKARGVVPGTPSYHLLDEQQRLLEAVEGMREQNPMLGLRGCRLSIIFPEVVEMQVRAIFQAACKLQRRGISVKPEIMIPLVGHVNELKLLREALESIAQAVMDEYETVVDYMFGTMIEIPRAAVTADAIAEYAEFFSFGTNDLTQTVFGFSRDDAEGKFLQTYVARKILPTNPFETIDRDGVGALMRLAVDKARAVKPELKLGICGEHGGDPDSIEFCHQLGLNYVSCSPFRVPIARLAAAQAALGDKVAVTIDK